MTSDDPVLSLVEQQAFQLSRVALDVDRVRSGAGLNSPDMVAALHDNLMVWIALRTIAQREDCSLMAETKRNLAELSNFMADVTFKSDALTDKTIDMVVNINLQICEGLLEGEKRAKG